MAYPKSWTCPSCKKSILNSAYCKNCAYQPNSLDKLRLIISRRLIVLLVIGAGLTLFAVLYFIGPIGGLCLPRWECTEWVAEELLEQSIEVRNCYDRNACSILFLKPVEARSDSLIIDSRIVGPVEFIKITRDEGSYNKTHELRRDHSARSINLSINEWITQEEIDSLTTNESLGDYMNLTCVNKLLGYINSNLVQDYNLKNLTLQVLKVSDFDTAGFCQAINDSVMREFVVDSTSYNLSYNMVFMVYFDIIGS